MMRAFLWSCCYAAAVMILLTGCSRAKPQAAGELDASITLATGTTLRDTGLLDKLVPTFEQQTGIEVKVVAVGTGQALELGRRGDADVVLTHLPEAEAKFVDEGYGEKRVPLMHNDFVVIGPASDP